MADLQKNLPESGQQELAKQKFRGRWWSYYERGAILMRYGRYAEAQEDFRVAMSKRAEDTRWARTYGLHFLPEYFPNRELGISYFEQGQFEEAENHLQRSYEHAKSARGAYYLNHVREHLIRDRNEDREPPAITLENGTSGPVGDVVFPVRLRVSDDTFVQSISIGGDVARTVLINNTQEPFELWSKIVEIERPVTLTPGLNSIEIVATDIAGNRSTKTITLTADHDGPAVNYEIAESDGKIVGNLADATGIAQFVIDGQPVARVALPTGDETFTVPVSPGRPVAGIEYIAKDTLGNETRGTFNGLSSVPRQSAKVAIALEAAALAEWYANAAVGGQTTGSSSGLDVTFLNLANAQEYFTADILANIAVKSDSAVTAIQVNGEDVPGIVETDGEQRVTRRIHLREPGQHRLVVRATNRNEVVAEYAVEITRRIPAVLDNKARLSVAVLGSLWVGGADVIPDVVNYVESELPAVLGDRGRFAVLSPESLSVALQEQELSTTLSDPKEAVRTGRIEGTDYLLIGDARRFGSNLEIVLHAIDAVTGYKVSADVYGPGATLEEAARLTADVSDRLAQAFPLAQGAVLSVERSGDALVTDLGARRMVWDSFPCIIYREIPYVDSVTGQNLGTDMRAVAEGTITKVRDSESVIVISGSNELDETNRPLPTDFVITK